MSHKLKLKLKNEVVSIKTQFSEDPRTILQNMVVPALLAHHFSEDEIYEDMELVLVAAGKLPPKAFRNKQADSSVTIAFVDDSGKALLDTDNITPVEVKLDQEEFLDLLDAANKKGLPFDKFITSIIEEECKKTIADYDEMEGGCE